MGVFIIAEAGVNHNGDRGLALALIDAAAKAGVDAVKFQTFSAEKVIGERAAKAAYQQAATGEGSQFEMLKQLELSGEDFAALVDHCETAGIEFMSTPFDHEAVDFLVSQKVKRLKIPSGEITNLPFLAHVAAKALPMILSTGMATLEEVKEAVAVIANTRKARDVPGTLADNLTLLHCTSNYPADPKDVNLLAMRTLQEETGLPVGYSDHTRGISVCGAAAALGATVLEKHFTLDRSMEGPDHGASLEPAELASMVTQVREIEQSLGSPEKAPTESEMEMRVLARRSVAANKDLVPGDILTTEHLAVLRPATGIHPRELADLPGRVVKNAVAKGEPIRWNDIVPVAKQ